MSSTCRVSRYAGRRCCLALAEGLMRQRPTVTTQRRIGGLAALLIGSCLAVSCAAGSRAPSSSSESGRFASLGPAIKSLDGFPIPSTARPFITAPSKKGLPTVAAFRLPGAVSDAAIESWFDGELPPGASWADLAACKGDAGSDQTWVSAAGQTTILERQWGSSAAHLQLSVTRQDGFVAISLALTTGAGASRYKC